jgi:beta-phosphoglucomutase-like phosphatase (HAD superfamily)
MKLILTDCDGVLLDWNATFIEWMALKGYKEVRTDIYHINERYGIDRKQSKALVREFNESAAVGFLKPFRDARYYVWRMYGEFGYKFRVITSLSLDPWAAKAREANLKQYFGDAIESVICLDCGADKDDALAPYKDSGMFWIEDKPENVEAGLNVGLRGILIDHEHNAYVKWNSDKTAHRAETWADIYDIVKPRTW